MNNTAYWSDKAKSLTPYTPGEQTNRSVIKLNTNENAYPPSSKVREAVLNQIDLLRLYPTPDAVLFKEAAARFNGVKPNRIFCGNGSDEVLAIAFQALFNPGEPVKTYDVTYNFYKVWAQLYNIDLVPVALKGDFTADVGKMMNAQAVVIANPNAPTSIALNLEDVEHIVKTARGAVIIDEAYFGFGAPTVLPLLEKYPNLLIVRTLSKSHSLAGLRAGYAIGSPDLIGALYAVKDSINSYPVDRLASSGAAAALYDIEHFEKTSGDIIKTREETSRALEDMGLSVLPSSANFIFVKMPYAKAAFKHLREKDILVRYFEDGRTSDYLRVTIGTPEQMRYFIEIMRGIV